MDIKSNSFFFFLFLLSRWNEYWRPATLTFSQNYVQRDSNVRIATERWTCAIYVSRARCYSIGSPRSTGINEKSTLEWRHPDDVRSDASSSKDGGAGDFFSFPNTMRSVRIMPSSRMSEKANERTSELACFSVRFMKSGGRERREGYPIWRGIRSRRPGTRLITVIRVHALCWNVKWADGKLIWIHICVNFRLWRVRPPRTLSIGFALLEILRKNSKRRLGVNRDLSSRLQFAD